MRTGDTENGPSLNVLILDEDPMAQVSLRDLVSRMGESPCSFSLFECPHQARESLDHDHYDLVFLEEKFGEVLEPAIGQNRSVPERKNPSFVMLTEGASPGADGGGTDVDVDAILSKKNLNDEILNEILRDVFFFDKNEKFPYHSEHESLYNRNYLKNYLNTILNRYRDTDFQWLLAMLDTQGTEDLYCTKTRELVARCFQQLADVLHGDEIIDPSIGRYDRGIFWGLFPCRELPTELTRIASRYLLDLDERLKREGPPDVEECNMVLHRLQPGDFDLNKLFEEIDRSLDRVDITPGPSVINHTYQ